MQEDCSKMRLGMFCCWRQAAVARPEGPAPTIMAPWKYEAGAGAFCGHMGMQSLWMAWGGILYARSID